MQLGAIGIEIFDRARGNTAFHGGFYHCQRDFFNQTRIKRFGDQVFRAKLKLFAIVGLCHNGSGFAVSQICNGLYAGLFHGVVYHGCTAIQRAPENKREAQDVIDLIGVV